MKQSKRWAAFTLAAVLCAAALTGCGGQDRKEAISKLTSTKQPTATAAPKATAPDREFEKGVIEGDTYINQSVGLQFTAAEGMTMQTDAQVAGWDDAEKVMEMVAFLPGGQSVIIIATKDPIGMYTPSSFIREMEWEMLNEEDGMTYESKGRSQRQVAGVAFEALDLAYTIELGGYSDTLQQTMMVCKQGDWLYTIVISYEEDEVQEMFLSCFSAV